MLIGIPLSRFRDPCSISIGSPGSRPTSVAFVLGPPDPISRSVERGAAGVELAGAGADYPSLTPNPLLLEKQSRG